MSKRVDVIKKLEPSGTECHFQVLRGCGGGVGVARVCQSREGEKNILDAKRRPGDRAHGCNGRIPAAREEGADQTNVAKGVLRGPREGLKEKSGLCWWPRTGSTPFQV